MVRDEVNIVAHRAYSYFSENLFFVSLKRSFCEFISSIICSITVEYVLRTNSADWKYQFISSDFYAKSYKLKK